MPEPTIDEMLAYLMRDTGYYGWDQMRAAIRTILEQHRSPFSVSQLKEEKLKWRKEVELEAIRAFVERVEKRWRGNWDAVLAEHVAHPSASYWYKAMHEELAAMEANDRTND